MLKYQGPMRTFWVTFKLHASLPPCRPHLKAAAYNTAFRGLLKPTNIPQPHTWLPDCIVFLMLCNPTIRLPRTSRVSVSFSRGSQDIVFDDSRPWHMLEDIFRLIRYIGAAAAARTLRNLFCNHPEVSRQDVTKKPNFVFYWLFGHFNLICCHPNKDPPTSSTNDLIPRDPVSESETWAIGWQ
jgi:hypothetical protein